MSDEQSFLSRWSRRKQEETAEPLEVSEDGARPTPDPEPEPEPEEWLKTNEMPAPETLGQGDDFSPFLKDGVPAILRRRALRALWRTNPTLANLDGLIDYGEDFTDCAMVPEVISTAYQVGKGIMRKVLDVDDSTADGDPDPEKAERVDERPGEPHDDIVSHDGPEDDAPAEEYRVAAQPNAEPEGTGAEFRPRRMTFREV